MARKMYVINESATPMRVCESAYAGEGELEELICNHPKLVSVSEGMSKEVLFVGSQINLGGLTMDSLFVTENGVPILAETKLSNNAEIKRDIISQLLVYSVNVSEVLTAQNMKKWFVENNASNTELLERFNNPDFWATAEQHINHSHFYLAFVADHFSGETIANIQKLDRDIENKSLYCVELAPYRVDATNEYLIERNVSKPTHPFTEINNTENWNFVRGIDLIRQGNPALVPLLQKLLTWFLNRFPNARFGKGEATCSLLVYKYAGIKSEQSKLMDIGIDNKNAVVWIETCYYKKQALEALGFDSLYGFMLDDELKAIGKTDLISSTPKYIKINLSHLSDPQVYAWFLDKVMALSNLKGDCQTETEE